MSMPLPPLLTALHTLPRSARDSLLVVLAAALVLLPQLPHLPLWASAITAGLLLWRTLLAWRVEPLPKAWLKALILLCVVALTATQFKTIFGPAAGAALIVQLLALKTLEMHARRDAMVVFFLGFFSLITVFIESQSLVTTALVLLALWWLLAALINAHRPVGQPRWRELLRQAASLLLWGLPLMVVLFVFFPRLPPLWGLPTDGLQGTTGLSEDMQVGQVASLAQDSSVALRVRFGDGVPPAQQQLYFRGPVLSHFDGRNWTATPFTPWGRQANNPPVEALEPGPGLEYEVTLEPHRQRWLLTLEATPQPPVLAQRSVRPSGQAQWMSPQPITEVLRYQAQAILRFRYGEQLTAQEQAQLRQLPAGSNPRTLAMGQQLRQAHGQDDQALIAAALKHLRTGGYTYTLTPGVYPSDTADAFWFDIQRGFCEHIASAFAVLMRSAGIPARIVTGYQGGERNAVDGLWTVRQSDAHAWTEVWLPGQGWLRIDPTAAVAPNRIELLQRLAPPPTLFSGTVGRMFNPNMLQQLRANWEALNQRWNDWVLSYNSTQQSQLFNHWNLSDWSGTRLALGLGGFVGGLLALAGAWHWHRWHQRDPWLRLLDQARRRLLAAGLADAPWLGPRQLAQALQNQWGPSSQSAQDWLLAMEQWRYASHSSPRPSLQPLRRNFRAVHWPPALKK